MNKIAYLAGYLEGLEKLSLEMAQQPADRKESLDKHKIKDMMVDKKPAHSHPVLNAAEHSPDVEPATGTTQ